jgi:hypothetical protein
LRVPDPRLGYYQWMTVLPTRRRGLFPPADQPCIVLSTLRSRVVAPFGAR